MAQKTKVKGESIDMLKTFIGCIREYKVATILTPILVVGEVVFDILIPFKTADLVDAINVGATMDEIVDTGMSLLLMAFISLIFGALAAISCSKASTGFAKNVRHDIFYNIQTFSFTTIDKFSTPSLVTRLTTDVANVQQSFMMIIRMAIRAPLMIIFAIIMAFMMGGSMAWVYVLSIIPLAIGLLFIFSKATPIFKRVFKKYDALNESVEENVMGMRIVKSFVREDYEKSKFAKATVDVQQDFTTVDKLLALNGPMMNLAMAVIYVVITYAASKLIIQSGGTVMNIGQFSSIFMYGVMVLMNLMMFSMVFAMISMSTQCYRRICEVLNAETTIKEIDNPVTEVKDGSIDFEDVSFAYQKSKVGDERLALSHINLHINSGEVIGIIGGTGSSKSTLVQLIPRLYNTTTGVVKVGGVDVSQYALNSLRKSVSMVLQKNQLFSGTIADNLRWGNPDATQEEIEEACKLAQADEFIELMPDKYETFIEQGGTNVSGGQKQRLCIARALLARPKILILDDSTSAVDTKTDKLIRKGFASYIPDTTKIIIAQRTSSIEDADRIIVMDDGTINDMGTHDELLERCEIYREIYTSQNKKSHDDRFGKKPDAKEIKGGDGNE